MESNKTFPVLGGVFYLRNFFRGTNLNFERYIVFLVLFIGLTEAVNSPMVSSLILVAFVFYLQIVNSVRPRRMLDFTGGFTRAFESQGTFERETIPGFCAITLIVDLTFLFLLKKLWESFL